MVSAGAARPEILTRPYPIHHARARLLSEIRSPLRDLWVLFKDPPFPFIRGHFIEIPARRDELLECRRGKYGVMTVQNTLTDCSQLMGNCYRDVTLIDDSTTLT